MINGLRADLFNRYNRTRSGWFDNSCFHDWFDTVVIPYLRRKSGNKVIIDDNLSSQFLSMSSKSASKMDIRFVCLPPNSTHICHPLDVSVFASMKRCWKYVLTQWINKEGCRYSAMPKQWFPRLLSRLLEEIQATLKQNLLSGFSKCGIVPFDKNVVIRQVVHEITDSQSGPLFQAVLLKLIASTNLYRSTIKEKQTSNFGCAW
jgi:hypothetical protein